MAEAWKYISAATIGLVFLFTVIFLLRPKSLSDDSEKIVLKWLDDNNIPTRNDLVIPYVLTDKYNSAKDDDDSVQMYKLAINYKRQNDEGKALAFAADYGKAWSTNFDGDITFSKVGKVKKKDIITKSYEIPSLNGSTTVPADHTFNFSALSPMVDAINFGGKNSTAVKITVMKFFFPKETCTATMTAPMPSRPDLKYYNLVELRQFNSKTSNTNTALTNTKFISCANSGSVPIVETCAATKTYTGDASCKTP